MPEVDKLPVEVGGDVVQEMTDRPRQNQILSGHDRPDNHMSPLQPKLNWPDVFFAGLVISGQYPGIECQASNMNMRLNRRHI